MPFNTPLSYPFPYGGQPWCGWAKNCSWFVTTCESGFVFSAPCCCWSEKPAADWVNNATTWSRPSELSGGEPPVFCTVVECSARSFAHLSAPKLETASDSPPPPHGSVGIPAPEGPLNPFGS